MGTEKLEKRLSRLEQAQPLEDIQIILGILAFNEDRTAFGVVATRDYRTGETHDVPLNEIEWKPIGGKKR